MHPDTMSGFTASRQCTPHDVAGGGWEDYTGKL